MNQRRAEQALSDYLERLLVPEPVIERRPLAEPEPEPETPALLPAAKSRLQCLLNRVGEIDRETTLATAPATKTETAFVVKTQTQSTTITTTTESAAATTATTTVTAAPVTARQAAPAPAEMASVPHPVSAVAEAVAQAQFAGYSNAQYRQDLPTSFPTLVFRIDDLRLALPLHLLGGIQRRDKPLTPLVGRAEWFMGLMPHEPDNINVVDTGRYLLGDKYRPELAENYRYVIRIGDTAWGLACTDLCATRSLHQDDVRWYDSNPARPWLAGMIKEDRCALLNAQALVDAFAQYGKQAA